MNSDLYNKKNINFIYIIYVYKELVYIYNYYILYNN